MLPAVRPATLLVTSAVTAILFTAVSLGIRLAALDQHGSEGISLDSTSGLAIAYRLVSTDDEGNLPTWFSAMLLACVALVSLGVSVVARAREGSLHRYWAGLAVIFGYLSLDEFTRLHEELIWQLDGLAQGGGYLAHPWVVVAAPLVVLFVLAYARFLLRLPRSIARLLVAAGVLYVGGALGLEIAGAPIVGFNVGYILITSAEELLEMLGAGLCLYAVARHGDELTRSGEPAWSDELTRNAEDAGAEVSEWTAAGTLRTGR